MAQLEISVGTSSGIFTQSPNSNGCVPESMELHPRVCLFGDHSRKCKERGFDGAMNG